MRKFSWYTTKKSKNGMYYGIGLYNLDEGLFVKYKPKPQRRPHAQPPKEL